MALDKVYSHVDILQMIARSEGITGTYEYKMDLEVVEEKKWTLRVHISHEQRNGNLVLVAGGKQISR